MTEASEPAPLVTLYGRPGCHLCDEAREELLALRGEGARFELHEVDIEDDERLLRAHLERIPVIEVDGEEVSRAGPRQRCAARGARSVIGSVNGMSPERAKGAAGTKAAKNGTSAAAAAPSSASTPSVSRSASPRGSRATSRC